MEYFANWQSCLQIGISKIINNLLLDLLVLKICVGDHSELLPDQHLGNNL